MPKEPNSQNRSSLLENLLVLVVGLALIAGLGYGGIVAAEQTADSMAGESDMTTKPTGMFLGQYNETTNTYDIEYIGKSFSDNGLVYVSEDITVEYGSSRETWNGTTRANSGAIESGSVHKINLEENPNIETVTIYISHPRYPETAEVEMDVVRGNGLLSD